MTPKVTTGGGSTEGGSSSSSGAAVGKDVQLEGAGGSGPPAMQGKPLPGAMDKCHKTPETAAAAAAETIQE
eukprot:9094226-Karenia_brevis.AAC.1